MSNDLISRSALLKEMEDYCGEQRYLIPENVWDMVKNMPTAYDVDKVVEQLDGEIFLTTNDDGETDNLSIKVMGADAVFKIVKAGGVTE